MTTLKPLPRSASIYLVRRRDWLTSLWWLFIAILCVGLLLFFLANPGGIARSPRSTLRPVELIGERPARVVPQGESAHDFPIKFPDGLSYNEPRSLTGEAGTTAPVSVQPPVALPVRESAGVTAYGRASLGSVLKIARSTPEVVTSPRYVPASGPDKALVPGTWIQVEVEFR